MVLTPVFAAISPPFPIFKLGTTLAVQGVEKVIRVIITILFIGGIIASFLHLIIGAYRWITAKGDKGTLQEAQQTIINAIVGLIILFSVYAILSLIGVVFDIDLLKLTIPTIDPGKGP